MTGFDPRGLVLDGLLTANVITPQQWEEYYNKKKSDRGSSLIAFLLKGHHTDAFVVLLNVLKRDEDYRVQLITDTS